MKRRLKSLAELVTTCDRAGLRPYLALEHIESGTGRLTPDVELLEREAPEAGAASVERGDVLFGKLRPYLAKSFLVDRPAYASTELICLRPHHGVEGRWLSYAVSSKPFVEWAVATSDGTKMPRTSWEKLAEFRVVVPPLNEQRAIADYLDRETARIDALIEKKRRMEELLEERWLASVRGELADVHAPDVRLRHIAAVKRGQSPRPIDNPIYFDPDGTHGWVRIEDAPQDAIYLTSTRDRLSAEGKRHSIAVGPGIVLVSIAASVGRVIITDIDCCYHDGWVGLLNLQAIPEYVLLCLTPPEMFGGLGQVGAQTNINSDIVGNIRIPLPDVDEQRSLVARMLATRRRHQVLLAQLRRQLDLLAEHRQALITAAVTGQLVIPGVAA